MRAARATVEYYHISFGPNKIARLVLRFLQRHTANEGELFFLFLAAEVQLSDEQKHRVQQLPEVRRVISYTDTTGETAVNHALRHPDHPYSPKCD